MTTCGCLRARCHTRCCRFTARFMTTWKSRRSPFSPRTCGFTSSRTTQTQYCSSHRNPVWYVSLCVYCVFKVLNFSLSLFWWVVKRLEGLLEQWISWMFWPHAPPLEKEGSIVGKPFCDIVGYLPSTLCPFVEVLWHAPLKSNCSIHIHNLFYFVF